MQRYGERVGEIPSEDADRAARWTIRFLAVALFVAVIAVVLRVSLLSLDDGSSGPAQGRAKNGAPATVEDLGPEAGVDLAAYAQNRRAALAGVTGDRVAVVSLASYGTEAQARRLVGALPVVALLVAPPDGSPSAVQGDLATWANAQTATIREERDEIRKLIPTVTDAAFKAFYTSEVERLDKAAKALTPTSAMVFGVVVRGPAPALQALAARPEVRLVDVAEGSEPGPEAAYRGLRPEEKVKAGDPAIRPA